MSAAPQLPVAPAAHAGEPVESRSKVKVTRNAKGDPQWEIAVVEGVTGEEMSRLRTLAVEQHQALVRELVGGTA